MARKIILRVFALLVIVVTLNFVYTFTFYQKDLREKCAEVLKIRETRASTHIYYFGESSNVTFRETDSTKSSISDLTALFYPGLRLTNINKYATHAGIYKHWIEEIEPPRDKVSAVVITLNLRSFDAAWIHSKLETQLNESMVMTRPYPNIVNRFFLSLQAFDNKTENQREEGMLEAWRTEELVFPFPFPHKTVAAWDYAMAQGTYTKEDGSWDTDKIALACHYIKGFAFQLHEDNPRIRDFDAIRDYCESKKMPLYLNLMAENISYADSLVGRELVFLMQQNRDFLVKRYHKGNTRVVDNLNVVDGIDFIDQNWTTEHYGYRGRMRIAKNLADTMRMQFKNEYIKAY